MADVVEFGLEESKSIKPQGLERFKLNRSGEVARVSIVAFKKLSDVIIAQKVREAGAALSDEAKGDIIAKIDAKLAERTGKKVEELTEVDRLDIQSPRFSFSWTHYRDGVGTIRCLSQYDGNTVTKADVCCNQMDPAEQTIATVVMVYPTEKNGQIDMDLFKMRKRIEFQLLRMTSKKFSRISSVYSDARDNQLNVIDLKLTLDGEPKYQKFLIENAMTPPWAKKDADEALRNWILDQGLRAYRYVEGELGYKISRDKLIEKLNGASASSEALSNGEASAALPKQASGARSYDDLLKD